MRSGCRLSNDSDKLEKQNLRKICSRMRASLDGALVPAFEPISPGVKVLSPGDGDQNSGRKKWTLSFPSVQDEKSDGLVRQPLECTEAIRNIEFPSNIFAVAFDSFTLSHISH